MKKKWKRLLGVLSVLTVLCASVGFVSCNKSTDPPGSEQGADGDGDQGGGGGDQGGGGGDQGGGGGDQSPASPTEGLAYRLSSDGTYYSVSGIGTATDTDVVIPSIYNNKPVKEIGEESFYEYRDKLTSIVIPDSVTSIGPAAFYGCDGLTSIVIPDSVTIIGYWAIAECHFLTSVTIGKGVISIGEGAFEESVSLTSIVIPDSVTSIGEYAFSACTSLTGIIIPDSVTSIGSCAFSGCDSLESIAVESGNQKYISKGNCLIEKQSGTLLTGCKNSVIPTDGSVTSIGEYAFGDCDNLTSVIIPDGVESIGSCAFYNCSSLTIIVIPDSVTSIGERIFQSCNSLESIVVRDDNQKYISKGNCLIEKQSGTLVVGCKKSVIPTDGSVTSIGEYAFYDCDNLTSIIIPDSVTSIGYDAFAMCSKLIEVYNLSDLTITAGSSDNGYVGLYAKNVYTSLDVPSKLLTTADGYIVYADDAAQEYYLVGYTGTATQLTLPEKINGHNYAIYVCAFRGCSSLTSIVIPDGVTSIGEDAFYNCSSLTSIEIPDSVTSIGNYAFYDCDKLTSVVIPDSVISIGNGAFYDCDKLTSIVIPDSVTSIGEMAFEDCSSLTNITVDTNNANYQSIDGNLYSKDGKTLIQYAIGKTATEFIIPDSVTSIDYSAFRECSNLTSVTFGENSQLTSIGVYAFSDCSSLTSIVIPDSVTSIGYGAFSDCSSLTSVTIGDGVTSISEWAFRRCSSLTSIVIPDSVTSIGYCAFGYCDNLTSVTFEDAEGWYVTTSYNATSGTYVTLTNTSVSAIYLKDVYKSYSWYKKPAA